MSKYRVIIWVFMCGKYEEGVYDTREEAEEKMKKLNSTKDMYSTAEIEELK